MQAATLADVRRLFPPPPAAASDLNNKPRNIIHQHYGTGSCDTLHGGQQKQELDYYYYGGGSVTPSPPPSLSGSNTSCASVIMSFEDHQDDEQINNQYNNHEETAMMRMCESSMEELKLQSSSSYNVASHFTAPTTSASYSISTLPAVTSATPAMRRASYVTLEQIASLYHIDPASCQVIVSDHNDRSKDSQPTSPTKQQGVDGNNDESTANGKVDDHDNADAMNEATSSALAGQGDSSLATNKEDATAMDASNGDNKNHHEANENASQQEQQQPSLSSSAARMRTESEISFTSAHPPPCLRAATKKLFPPVGGFNLCLLIGDINVVVDKVRVDGTRVRLAEVILGDETGTISFRARDEQIDLLQRIKLKHSSSSDVLQAENEDKDAVPSDAAAAAAAAVVLRNCTVELYKNKHMRMAVTKWGKLYSYDEDSLPSTPKPPTYMKDHLNFSLADLSSINDASVCFEHQHQQSAAGAGTTADSFSPSRAMNAGTNHFHYQGSSASSKAMMNNKSSNRNNAAVVDFRNAVSQAVEYAQALDYSSPSPQMSPVVAYHSYGGGGVPVSQYSGMYHPPTNMYHAPWSPGAGSAASGQYNISPDTALSPYHQQHQDPNWQGAQGLPRQQDFLLPMPFDVTKTISKQRTHKKDNLGKKLPSNKAPQQTDDKKHQEKEKKGPMKQLPDATTVTSGSHSPAPFHYQQQLHHHSPVHAQQPFYPYSSQHFAAYHPAYSPGVPQQHGGYVLPPQPPAGMNPYAGFNQYYYPPMHTSVHEDVPAGADASSVEAIGGTLSSASPNPAEFTSLHSRQQDDGSSTLSDMDHSSVSAGAATHKQQKASPSEEVSTLMSPLNTYNMAGATTGHHPFAHQHSGAASPAYDPSAALYYSLPNVQQHQAYYVAAAAASASMMSKHPAGNAGMTDSQRSIDHTSSGAAPAWMTASGRSFSELPTAMSMAVLGGSSGNFDESYKHIGQDVYYGQSLLHQGNQRSKEGEERSSNRAQDVSSAHLAPPSLSTSARPRKHDKGEESSEHQEPGTSSGEGTPTNLETFEA